MDRWTPYGPPRWEHQRRGLRKLIETRGRCALLFDPGLGKSATTLDYASLLALRSGRETRVLVLAPLAALDTWVIQAQQYVDPAIDLWVEVLGGSIRQRAESLARRGGHPILRSPGPARDGQPRARGWRLSPSLAVRQGNVPADPRSALLTPVAGRDAPVLVLCALSLSSFSSRAAVGSRTMADVLVQAVERYAPDLIVVDEAHLLKGHTSNMSRAVSRLTPLCRRRVMLTGTVMPHALTLDSPILTPTGWKPMGEMQVGEQVIGADGKPTEVVGVWPQGERPIFTVTFSDGSSVDCTEDHLWTVTSRGRRSRSLPPLTLPTGDLVKGRSRSRATIQEVGLLDKGGAARWAIPTVEPVDFPSQPVPLDPYLMGLLLGDGHLGHPVDFTTADEEIAKYAESAFPPGLQLTVTPGQHGSRASRYRITSGKKGGSLPGTKRGPAPNAVAVALDELGLRGLRGHEKFVPEVYLWNDLETRLGVLRGLMDADGTASVGSTSKFVTTSPRLAEAIKHLVRSLGGYVTERVEQKQPTVMPQGHTSPTRPQHVLLFGMPFNPFRVSRKAKQWLPRTEQKLRTIVGIKPKGTALAQCITVAAEDGLFVTRDFVVTHNSPLDVFAQWRFLEPGAFGTRFDAFQHRYAVMGGFQNRQPVRFQHLDHLREVMGRNAVVATKEESLDLPPTTDAVVPVHLDGPEQQAYDDMKAQLAATVDDQTITVPNRLAQMMRLRQITSGFLPSPDGTTTRVGDSKAQTVRSLVQDTLAGERRIVVFAHFRAEITRLAELLDTAGTEVRTITGDTPAQQRQAIRAEFGPNGPQDKRIVLIAQVRTLSLSVNELVTASHAVYTSLPLTRDDLQQSRDRLNRPGQTRPVTFWTVEVGGSVDSVIRKAHHDRTRMEDALLAHLRESDR